MLGQTDKTSFIPSTITNYLLKKIKPILTPKVQVETHLKPVEAAVRLENKILGVLQRINVAILNNEVAQVLCLWGEAFRHS